MTSANSLERIGARLLSLLGPERLDTIQEIIDALRADPSPDPAQTLARVHGVLEERAPVLAQEIRVRGLCDHQHQDMALALLLLTHPAVPADASRFLILRILGGWRPDEMARQFGWPRAKVGSRLHAGVRRIQVLGLRMEWPRRRELPTRVEHALGIVAALPETRRRRKLLGQRCTHLLPMATRLTEELRTHPNTRGRTADAYYWRARYRELQDGSVRQAG